MYSLNDVNLPLSVYFIIFFINIGADVNRKTSGNEHSVLSLACAGGHAAVVELLLTRGASASMKLKVILHHMLKAVVSCCFCDFFLWQNNHF